MGLERIGENEPSPNDLQSRPADTEINYCFPGTSFLT